MIPSEEIVALEAFGRKFLFFVNDQYNIVYYERPHGVGGQKYTLLPQQGIGGIVDDGTAAANPLKTASRIITGVTYANGKELRIYYIVEDSKKPGNYLLRERAGQVTEGVSKIKWQKGQLNDSSYQIRRDSLLTAMVQPTGLPLVIFQGPGDNNLRQAYQTVDTTASTGNSLWSQIGVSLDPVPTAVADQD